MFILVIEQVLTEIWHAISHFSIYTLSDLGVLSNLIGSLSLANEHYSNMNNAFREFAHALYHLHVFHA